MENNRISMQRNNASVMAGAEAAVRTFLDAGIDTCFANPGTSEMALVAALELLCLPAPASRQMAESVAKYVIVDMFAGACTGKSTPEVIKTAEAQLKQIYA
jgi:thiamine pyrophosphate-dependent acetolactate synthase large subunit-like protein